MSYHQPIFQLCREDIVEVVVYGAGATYKSSSGQIAADLLPANETIIMRSLAKPWQFLGCGLEKFDVPALAIGFGSHSGHEEHAEALKALSELAEAPEDALICPRCYPLDGLISAKMKMEGLRPTRLQHPCAGKHLSMILSCRENQWAIRSYWEKDHPLQKKISQGFSKEAGEKVTWVKDSCGLQSPALSMLGVCSLWQRLAQGTSKAHQHLKHLWSTYPLMLGGKGRLDSELSKTFAGKLLAKEGADGLLIIQTLGDSSQYAGCFVKLAAGYNAQHLALALWGLLSRWQGPPEIIAEVREYLSSRLEGWIPADQRLEVLLP